MFKFIKSFLGIQYRSKDDIRDQVKAEYQEYKQQQIHRISKQLNQQQTQSQEAAGLTEGGNIIFAIDGKGQITIQVNWSKPEPHVAEYLGKLFYHVNNGHLEQNCFAILEDSINHKPKASTFLKNIVDTWKKMKDENEPVLKPSEVFKLPVAGISNTSDDE